MTREHTELLAELEKLCFARPWSQKALLDEVDNPNAYFVTAVDGDIVLGYGGMHCACKEYYMDNVAVFGHHRRKGVGSAIVEALAAEAKRRGGEFISLEVRPSNAQALRLYTRLGFAEEGRRPEFLFQPHRGCAFAHQKVLITVKFRGRKRQRPKASPRGEAAAVGG